MEDYAARIPHTEGTPNVAIVPFFNILSQMSYSVLWPLSDLEYGGECLLIAFSHFCLYSCLYSI